MQLVLLFGKVGGQQREDARHILCLVSLRDYLHRPETGSVGLGINSVQLLGHRERHALVQLRKSDSNQLCGIERAMVISGI